MAKENNFKDFAEALGDAKRRGFVEPVSKEFGSPVPVRCIHCGKQSKITQATLYMWPEREAEQAGWVVNCPVCGNRQVLKNEIPLALPSPLPKDVGTVAGVGGAAADGTRAGYSAVTKTTKKKSGIKPILLMVLIVFLLYYGSAFIRELLMGPKEFASNGSSGGNRYYADNDDTDSGEEQNTNNDSETAEADSELAANLPEDQTLPTKSRYEVHWEDVNWDEAEESCENMSYNGVTGHLATITSQEEYDEVTRILDEFIADVGGDAKEIKYVWLGGWISNSDAESYNNNYQWVTGEDWTFSKWCETVSNEGNRISEPSFIDENMGIIENRLILWGFKQEELGWTFSDQNDRLLDVYPSSSGKIAYICEYDASEY